MTKHRLIWPAALLAAVLAVPAAADFPDGITSYSNSSYEVRSEGLAYGDYTGPGVNRHLTVSPTDEYGDYDVYVVFSNADVKGVKCRALYATKPSDEHGSGSFDVYDIDSLSISWPSGYDTYSPALTSDDDGNIYITVWREAAGVDVDPYSALAWKNTSGVWNAVEIYGRHPAGRSTYADTAHGSLSVSRDGEYFAFSTQFAKYPGPFYGGCLSWAGRIWCNVYDKTAGIGGDWDAYLFGGYDSTATGYWSSTCAVSETGQGLVLAFQYTLDRFPMDYYDAGAGLNFGVGGGDEWAFARCPFENYKCTIWNNFSLAPYVEDYDSSEVAHLVWDNHVAKTNPDPLRYASYTFGASPLASGWSELVLLNTGLSEYRYAHPQCTTYVTDGDPAERYLIVVFEAVPNGTANARVCLGMWDLNNNCDAVFDAFEVAPGEEWGEEGEAYEQKFPNVCVEKTGGEDEFDIHVLWTNCVWAYYPPNDPEYPVSGDPYYRAFHYAPPE